MDSFAGLTAALVNARSMSTFAFGSSAWQVRKAVAICW